jgi:hypothetical protein
MLENTSPRHTLRLGMLELHGHLDNTAADQSAARRLFGLLAQKLDMAPELTSVRLHSLYYDPLAGLSACAFRNLALRPGLQQLWLQAESPNQDEGHVVKKADVESVAAMVDNDPARGVNYYRSSSSGQNHEPLYCSHVKPCQPGPLKHLNDLRVFVCPTAMPPLVMMLGSLTSLLVDVWLGGHPSEVSALVFPAVAKLRSLRHLQVVLPKVAPIAPEDLSPLQHLVQLRELSIIGGTAISIGDEHLDALLRPLGQLRLLGLISDLPKLSPGVLQVIAKTRGRLRRLQLFGTLRIDLLPESGLEPSFSRSSSVWS